MVTEAAKVAMHKQSTGLAKQLMAVVVLSQLSLSGLAQEPKAQDYALSMAGALINNWCSTRWQDSGYISLHACNYELAQLYNRELSSRDFQNCAVANGGDIVKIADCMLERYNTWVTEEVAEAPQ